MYFMSKRPRWLRRAGAAVLAVCLPAAVCMNSARAEEEPRKGVAKGPKKTTPLADHMIEITRAMRKIKRNLADPRKNGDSLELLDAVQKHALAAKSMTPSKAKKLPAQERGKLLKAYREGMIELLKELLDLEQLLLAGKNDAARRKYQHIRRLEKKAHERFQVEEIDSGAGSSLENPPTPASTTGRFTS